MIPLSILILGGPGMFLPPADPDPQNHRELMTELHLLVTAHPDDESMFFLPTIRYWKQEGATVWLLCLTTGNYDGLGTRRTRELQECCHVLAIDRLIQINDKNLPDHPLFSWNFDVATARIDHLLREATSTFDRIRLYTFDRYGVSGHMNHCDTYNAVRRLVNSATTALVSVQTLRTEHNLLKKYIPLLSWLHLLLSMLGIRPKIFSATHQDTTVVRMADPMLNWKAMATHRSQFVWYRRLFMVFSCYTYCNVWEDLE